MSDTHLPSESQPLRPAPQRRGLNRKACLLFGALLVDGLFAAGAGALGMFILVSLAPRRGYSACPAAPP
jgi:hypothetical protein